MGWWLSAMCNHKDEGEGDIKLPTKLCVRVRVYVFRCVRVRARLCVGVCGCG